MKNVVHRSRPHSDLHRFGLIEEFSQRYGEAGNSMQGLQLRCWVKKYAWRIIIGGTLALKRLIDMSVAGVLLVGLSPLFMCVFLAIKLTAGGPALSWQTRVGRWGGESPLGATVFNTKYGLGKMLV